MPKKKEESFADFRARMVPLLHEALREAIADRDASQAGRLQLALLDIERLREFDHLH
jgi:hypothetical protein